MRGAAWLVLPLLLVPACGSDPDITAGAPPDAPVTATPDPSATQVRGGAQEVEAVPGQLDVAAQRFDHVKRLDKRSVRVFFYQGVAPCSVLDSVDVEYRTRTIALTLRIGRAPDSEDVACIELAVFNYVDVVLDEPIHGRRIVDGAR